MQDTYFPVEFMTIRQVARSPAAGVYLRWFVKPYLGLPGIDPLHESGPYGSQIEQCGFRLFFTDEHDDLPSLSEIPIDPLIPEDRQATIRDVVTRPGWRAILRQGSAPAKLGLDLHQQFGDQVGYLRFNYCLGAGQRLELTYKIRNRTTGTDRVHQVDLHFDPLVSRLDMGQHESLTYAIHVDDDDEAVVEVSLTSNKSIVLGKISYALSGHVPFFTWSPGGGGGIWRDVVPDTHLIRTLDDQLIQPGAHRDMVRAMTDFYDKYHRLVPHQVDGSQRISFEFPDLSQFGLNEPPLREYVADQYRELREGGYEPGPGAPRRFYMPPQDAAALASADPAVAYLLGLFRVLESTDEFDSPRIFKVQGTWPDSLRFCIYSVCDPAIRLAAPRMSNVKASSKASTRVLRDYATFRTHHRINVSDVRWDQMSAGSTNQLVRLEPVAFLILGESQRQASIACKSSFYVPQTWEIFGQPPEVHFTDWLDHYQGTDIHKVLDGAYTYHVASFDVFGQLSNYQSANTQIAPAKLEPGEIQRPETMLSKLPAPNSPSTLERVDIPLEVETTTSGFVLRGYKRNHLSFDYSFFWPLDARYLWNVNRATQKPSIDHFRLLYLVDIPLSSDVQFDSLDYVGDGAKVKFQDIGSSIGSTTPENHVLFDLLTKLGAVDGSGNLLTQIVDASLAGGSFLYEKAWDIVKASVDPLQRSIELQLVPASDAAREDLANRQFFKWPNVVILGGGMPKLTGQVYWNLDASFGGSRLVWTNLTAVGEKIQPTAPTQLDQSLIAENILPTAPVAFPSDLAQTTGIVVSKAAPDQSPPKPVEYGFVIRLDKDHELAKHDRFFLVPADTNGNLLPGEYAKESPPPGSDVEYPDSVNTLFSEDLIVSFYASRSTADPGHPDQVVYRGAALPFRSSDPGHPDELLLFPSTTHQKWLALVPTTIKGKTVPLASFVQKGFNQDDYLTTNITMGLLAVASGQDTEVKDSLQRTLATEKLSLVRYVPPPQIQIPSAIPPAFGVSANRPDYYGRSLIRLGQIYDDIKLEDKLAATYQYRVYALPADRVTASDMKTTYALDPAAGNVYRRNMIELKTALEGYHLTDPLSNNDLQKLFADFAQPVHDAPSTKSEFLNLPVELPGESRTVFLYAIKAYDPTTRRESSRFACLSRPIYVEDPTPPALPVIHHADVVLRHSPLPGNPSQSHYALHFDIAAARHLTEPIVGYAGPTELTGALLGSDFYQMIARYRLYVTTGRNEEALISPDDSDFRSITSASPLVGDPTSFPGFDVKSFDLMLGDSALTIQTTTQDPDSVQILGTLSFHPSVDGSNLPSRLYLCLRAENYLGQLSRLTLFPTAPRELV